MLETVIGPVVRTMLASVAGYLVGKGYIDSDSANAIVGSLGGLFVVTWSILQKKGVIKF
jgi:hypothetical protein